MAAPGVYITDRAAQAAGGFPTDTGQAFLVGLTERGPLEPVQVRSLDEAIRTFGDRVTYGYLYDVLDVAFADGLGSAWIGRRVGPAAVQASLMLLDALADSLEIVARDPGGHGNDLTVAVTVDGATFDLEIAYQGTVVERYRDLASPQDAEEALQASEWVRGTAQAGGNPDPLAATALTGGVDDRANVNDTTLPADLDRFSRDYGPGQVAAPGVGTDAAHAALQAHAAATNRTAVLDVPAGSDYAALVTLAGTIAAGADSNYGAGFGPWVYARGVAGGTRRLVPASAFAIALAGRNDADGHPINSPAKRQGRTAAGSLIIDVETTFTTEEYDVLNGLGINLIRPNRNYGIHMAGWRATTDQTAWTFLADRRTAMKLIAEGEAIAEEFLYGDPIDGPGGRKLTGLRAALLAMLDRNSTARAFYTATGDPADADYDADIDTVNTPATIAAGEIHARLVYTLAGTAERVLLDFVKSRIAA